MKSIYFTILLSLASSALVGKTVIRGVVSDKNTREPIVGVNIEVVGTDIGSFSDKDGQFRIQTNHLFPIELKMSHIGFETVAMIIQDDQPIDYQYF